MSDHASKSITPTTVACALKKICRLSQELERHPKLKVIWQTDNAIKWVNSPELQRPK
jgi:hypothetical protein